MSRIILDSSIANLLERINPPNDLSEHVPDYDHLSVLTSVFPSRLYRSLSRLLGSSVQFGEDVELIGAVEIYVSFDVVR